MSMVHARMDPYFFSPSEVAGKWQIEAAQGQDVDIRLQSTKRVQAELVGLELVNAGYKRDPAEVY